MNPSDEIFENDTTTDAPSVQPRCKFGDSATRLDGPMNLEDQVYGRGVPPYRPSLEKTLTPSYQSLTSATSSFDRVHTKIEKIACLGSGFVGGLN